MFCHYFSFRELKKSQAYVNINLILQQQSVNLTSLLLYTSKFFSQKINDHEKLHSQRKRE